MTHDGSPPAAPPAGAACSLTERAYRILEEDIAMLRLAPGAAVSEAVLSQRCGLGRTPVREALQRLAREGLVRVLPRRGIVVTEIDIARQLRLLAVRREIERLLARTAATEASPAQRARFADIAAGMEDAAAGNDDTAFMRLDRAFNLLLLESARNEFAAGAMALMNGLSRRFWYMHYREVADLARAARLHAAVARAVADGAPAAAAEASDALIDYIDEFARAACQTHSGG
ncbi:GntR family transcriptional regulator [Acidibrevibacterium fodinaquatile]|uniref:GntR family transcriptional regulator n=1 Tax=Acidibrevibacterium fodinaquatile TaxID=1969806 RepID=UPI000E0CCBB7|nr:GntR family transcriptional regulator [Acidibrevibacterium fodinaquatile]